MAGSLMKYLQKHQKGIIILIVAIFVIIILLGCFLGSDKLWRPPFGKDSKEQEGEILNLSEAIEIGKKELKKIGYSYWNEELLVEADDKNTAWNDHIDSSPSVLDDGVIKQMHLKERQHWAIYYCPKRLVVGGDAFVFIDCSNGKVIGVLFGE